MTEVIKNRQSCSRSASWKGGRQVKPESRSASPLETPRTSWRAPPTIANPLILFPSPVWLPRRGAPQRWQCSLQPHRRHCAHVSANVDLCTHCRFAWLGLALAGSHGAQRRRRLARCVIKHVAAARTSCVQDVQVVVLGFQVAGKACLLSLPAYRAERWVADAANFSHDQCPMRVHGSIGSSLASSTSARMKTGIRSIVTGTLICCPPVKCWERSQ